MAALEAARSLSLDHAPTRLLVGMCAHSLDTKGRSEIPIGVYIAGQVGQAMLLGYGKPGEVDAAQSRAAMKSVERCMSVLRQVGLVKTVRRARNHVPAWIDVNAVREYPKWSLGPSFD